LAKKTVRAGCGTADFGRGRIIKESEMKQYLIGFITAVCLTASTFLFIGAQRTTLGDIVVNSIVVRDNGRGGYIATYNEQGKETSYLGTGKNGVGFLRTSDAYGNQATYLGSGEEGNGFLSTFKAGSFESAFFGTGEDGVGKLRTFNSNGRQTVYLGTSSGGSGFLETANVVGIRTGYFGTDSDRDGIAGLFDRYGDHSWNASSRN
tara:strand:- start:537 stop:1154 length:618 start_codon:yes stop_codon:yes gene_type:complete